MRRLASLFTLVTLLWLPAATAHADPAGPTNYRSTLTSTPDVPGVDISVFGGDSFLVIEVEPGSGHEVIVFGYEHTDTVADPYLRVEADGTVSVNRRSPARWKNEDRYQAVEIPDFVDASAPADWEVVATDGRYAWHDHRIHWMSTALPPTIDADGGIQVVPTLEDWRVPIAIDGVETELVGTLTWEPSPSPIPWVAVMLVVAASAAVVGRSSPDLLFLVIGGGAALALVVGAGSTLGLPPGVGIVLPLVILPVVSLGAAMVVRTREGAAQVALLAASALPLAAWSILQFGALTNPIVPSSLPVLLIRLAAAASLGIAAGAVLAAVSDLFGGNLADLAALADDDAPGEAASTD